MAQVVSVSNNKERAINIGGKTLRLSQFIGSTLSSDKSEFEARMNVIDSGIAQAIAAGRARVTDYVCYTAKALDGNTTQEIFEAKDQKEVGVCNINNRKLEASQYMLVTGIQILFGALPVDVAATANTPATYKTDNKSVKNACYGVIPATVDGKYVTGGTAGEIVTNPDLAIYNGEFEFKLDNKVLIPRTSLEVFNVAEGGDKKKMHGYYRLECPVMLTPQTDIIPQIWIPAGNSETAKKFAAKVSLHGVRVCG